MTNKIRATVGHSAFAPPIPEPPTQSGRLSGFELLAATEEIITPRVFHRE
ncbi:hypothetical protein ACFY1G_05325 [Streptomyces olivaceus]|nr:hypothetical protein [Streptomyces olivaceus]MBZ6294745.1 hypothetical protein [Streptomyces olivaceus]MBZ6309479.1 hypothetical protein [Streptomyces olivaceus]MBZ6323262.1 hypothetical protein [Streptomyces olivaceus]MBZ6329710.1 hypothetical protein [Streptomyces olivaceus]